MFKTHTKSWSKNLLFSLLKTPPFWIPVKTTSYSLKFWGSYISFIFHKMCQKIKTLQISPNNVVFRNWFFEFFLGKSPSKSIVRLKISFRKLKERKILLQLILFCSVVGFRFGWENWSARISQFKKFQSFKINKIT
jgi:hypothetical protein